VGMRSAHKCSHSIVDGIKLSFSIVDCVSLLLVGESKNEIDTIKRGDITYDCITKSTNRKGNNATLKDSESRSIFLNPT